MMGANYVGGISPSMDEGSLIVSVRALCKPSQCAQELRDLDVNVLAFLLCAVGCSLKTVTAQVFGSLGVAAPASLSLLRWEQPCEIKPCAVNLDLGRNRVMRNWHKLSQSTRTISTAKR